METDMKEVTIEGDVPVIEKKEKIEKPIQKDIKKTKKMPKKRDKQVEEFEEVTAKPKEAFELPVEEIIEEKKHVIETADVLEEVVSEFQTEIPKTEKAIVDETKEDALITKVDVGKSAVKVANKEVEIKKEIMESIETPKTKKKIQRKKVKYHEDVPEEILEDIVLEKPEMGQAQTIFSPRESIEVTQILTESSIAKFTDDKTVSKEAAEYKIKEEEKASKKISREETNVVPVQEEITVQSTKEIFHEKPKEEEIKLTIITKEGLKVTEITSDTFVGDLVETKPTEERVLPHGVEEPLVKIKEVTVKKAPKKIKPVYASKQVEEEIVEDITLAKPTEEIAEKIIMPNEEIQIVEIVSESTTGKLDKNKIPQGEQIAPTEETEKDIKSTELIITKKPLVKKKAIEVKEDRLEEVVEDLKVEKPKKKKAKQDVRLQESVEISEIETEIIPEEFEMEKSFMEKETESSIVPIEEKIFVKSKKEQTTIDEVALKPTEVVEIIPKDKIEDTLKEKEPKDKLEEVEVIHPKEVKELEKQTDKSKPTIEEKLIESKPIEKEKKIIKKKKKKPVKKDDIEEWVEPEYERPVLEPMPEKIQWEPTKKKKEKKALPESIQKLVPQKIERKEIKPTKLKYIEPTPEVIQFGTIKLKKVSIVKKKEISEPKFPKITLRSRIIFIDDYPTELQMPKVTYMEKNPVQAGILSRNTEEALEILKKKYKKPKLSEKDLIELEKVDKEFEELKKVPLEKIEDKSIYERTPKKPQKIYEEPEKLMIGKGEIKQEDKIIQEEVKLKKIPTKKPEEETEEIPKSKKEKPVEDVSHKKEAKPNETITLDKFKSTEFESPEIEKYIPSEFETTKKPEIEPVSKPYEPSKKKKPKQDVEQIPLIIGTPKTPEPEDVPEIKFRIPTSEKPKDEPEIITLKGWKKDKPEEDGTEEQPTKEKDIIPTVPKETTDDFKVKQKKKPKKIKEEGDTIKEKPKEKHVTEEFATDVIVKKPVPKEEEQVPEEICETIVQKKPKEEPPKEEGADKVTITKPVIEETKDVEEVTEKVRLKKKPKKKPVIEEPAAEIVVKKPIPKEEEQVPEEISEKIVLKPKEEPLKEEVADEVTIKKPVIEEVKEDVEEVIEKVTLKKKPKKKPIIEEPAAEIVMKKPVSKKEEQVPEEISEKIVIKKPKKEFLKEEVADEVTIKKPIIEERKEDVKVVAEEVTLKKKRKEKPVTEEIAVEATIKKPVLKDEEQVPEEISEKVILKKPKKESLKEEVTDEITIKKPTVVERKEDANEVTEEVTLKPKLKKKVIEMEEISEVTIAKPMEDKKVEEEITADVLLKDKKPKIKDEITEELTIQKIVVVEQPEEVIEEFTLKRKPPTKAPKPIEEIYEDITLRKLRPKKKIRPDIKEITEVENVTFRPRSTKTKEDVEQEFKISLNTYEEEDISMFGKVRLKSKRRPLTYSEETGEETIKIIQEIEDDSGPIIEEIIDESEEEGAEEYSIKELDIDDMNIPLRRKKKKQKVPYTVEEIEEDDVKLQLKKDRKYSYEETDAESLALKLKSKRRISTFEEGSKMTI